MAIVVKIELWPGGQERGKTTLGTLIIANDGTGRKTIGNYDVTFLSRIGTVTRRQRVERWPRTARSVWGLIARVFEQGEQPNERLLPTGDGEDHAE